MPTTVTAAQIQRIIGLRVGDVDPTTGEAVPANSTGLVSVNLESLWAARADKARIAPRLQELYTQRDAIDLVIAALSDQVDISLDRGGDVERLHQRIDTQNEKRKAVQEEIQRVEKRARAMRGYQIGPITAVEPVTPPVALPVIGPLDANDPRISGSPYIRPIEQR